MLIANQLETTMKYALANEQRLEAQPGLSGQCPSCDAPMMAKCGEVKIWHWAHRGKRVCDHWWENETEWHRTWKGHFPENWQEIVHRAENGERHIADVKTDQDWVMEFQHSFLNPEERRSRNAFYPKLVWVVNGARRKRDIKQFAKVLKDGTRIFENLPVLKLNNFSSDECGLLREWGDSHVPIFFDFGGESELWYLVPKISDGIPYVVKFSRAYFINLFRTGAQSASDLGFWFNELSKIVANPPKAPVQYSPLPQRYAYFPQFPVRGRRSRGRF
jgi:competence protein CoiA